jgi:hypothetical protein
LAPLEIGKARLQSEHGRPQYADLSSQITLEDTSTIDVGLETSQMLASAPRELLVTDHQLAQALRESLELGRQVCQLLLRAASKLLVISCELPQSLPESLEPRLYSRQVLLGAASELLVAGRDVVKAGLECLALLPQCRDVSGCFVSSAAGFFELGGDFS